MGITIAKGGRPSLGNPHPVVSDSRPDDEALGRPSLGNPHPPICEIEMLPAGLSFVKQLLVAVIK